MIGKALKKKFTYLVRGTVPVPELEIFICIFSYLFPPRTCEIGICHSILQFRKPKAIMKKFSNFTKVSYI